MIIVVGGSHEVRHAPERAVVHLSVAQEGNVRTTVLAAVSEAANVLKRELDALASAGRVERVVVEPPRTWSWKPRRQQERFSATVEVRVTFTDLEALGPFAADAGSRPLVRLGGVGWELTDATRRRLQDDAIAAAIARARERAEAMARAAGAGDLRVLKITDPGLMDAPGAGVARYAMAAMSRGGEDAAPVEIVPEDVSIDVSVQVRFEATEA